MGAGLPDYTGFPFHELKRATLEAFAASPGTPADLFTSLGAAFGQATGATPGSRRPVVEKTPDNEFRLHAARRWWPGSRLIYLVRDPRAAFNSHAAKTRGRDTELPVETFVLHYARSLATALRHCAETPGLCLVVKYEDLVTDPEAELRRLCRFLSMEFHPSLLEPTKLGRPWRAAGGADVTPYGVTASRVGAWRDELEREDVEYIEAFLGKAMMLLGYPLAAGVKSSREFLATLRGPIRLRWETLRALASLYKPVGIVWRSRTAGRRGGR